MFNHSVIQGESATKFLLDAVTVTGASSAWLPVANNRSFQIVITGTASVAIEGTNNVMTGVAPSPLAANWIRLAITPVTRGFEINGPWKAVRANVLSLSSGSATVILGT